MKRDEVRRLRAADARSGSRAVSGLPPGPTTRSWEPADRPASSGNEKRGPVPIAIPLMPRGLHPAEKFRHAREASSNSSPQWEEDASKARGEGVLDFEFEDRLPFTLFAE
jgi:hypothetical protein